LANRAVGWLAALSLITTSLVACGAGSGLKVGLAFGVGGPGDDGFNDSALAGLNQARTDLRGSIAQVRALAARANETPDDQYQRLSLLCKAGYNPVIAVGFTYAGADPSTGPLARASKDCPDTHFAIVDDDSVQRPNVANLVFADEQGAYLMGIVAAKKSRTNVIGLVGACSAPVITRFLAGYQAGARAIKPDIIVNTGYLSTNPLQCDFTDVAQARTAAAGLYTAGADVVFQVAGGAGIGVFEAAKTAGRHAIGVDTDQYQTVNSAIRSVILTSMIKHVNVAVFDFIRTVSQGRFVAGVRRYALADGGLTYATSGDQITDLVPLLDDYRKKIISGEIVVPVST
jgi:basic membrane protein A